MKRLIIALLVFFLIACQSQPPPADISQPPSADITEVAWQAFKQWASEQGIQYDEQMRSVNVEKDDFLAQAQVRIITKLKYSATADWEQQEATIECRKEGDQWQCDREFNFNPTATEIAQPATVTANVQNTPTHTPRPPTVTLRPTFTPTFTPTQLPPTATLPPPTATLPPLPTATLPPPATATPMPTAMPQPSATMPMPPTLPPVLSPVATVIAPLIEPLCNLSASLCPPMSDGSGD